jgi:hypothetical protein
MRVRNYGNRIGGSDGKKRRRTWQSQRWREIDRLSPELTLDERESREEASMEGNGAWGARREMRRRGGDRAGLLTESGLTVWG